MAELEAWVREMAGKERDGLEAWASGRDLAWA